LHPLWQADGQRRAHSLIHKFGSQYLGDRFRDDYWRLHQWSVTEPNSFWLAVSRFCKIAWAREPASALPASGLKFEEWNWFPGGELNYAANLLHHPECSAGSCPIAIIGHAEGSPRIEVTFAELEDQVRRIATVLQAHGVGPGSVVAGILANIPEAIVACLATAYLGGVWASCSPDMGIEGVVDRLNQVQPKVLFHTKSYVYAGKHHVLNIDGIIQRFTVKPQLICVDHLNREQTSEGSFAACLHQSAIASPPTPMPSAAPLFVMFSSGTTGAPKCIVHSIAGTLLQHVKELQIHGDLQAGDKLLFFTTLSWMMWNWQLTALANGTTIVCFDGAPGHPTPRAFWQTVAAEGVTALGTSPKFLAATAQAHPQLDLELPTLKTIFSTGSPLLAEQFEWVYRSVKSDVHLASISGGTDIISCFMLGNVLLPVHAGEIQAPGLGMAVEAWDDAGKSIRGERGELVCTRPFPSTPIGFLGDEGNKRFMKTYFTRFPGVWHHGDFVEITPRGGIIVHGRSDATLNPGGVRIGTAELYRQLALFPEVVDSVAVDYQGEICLFVKTTTAWSDTLVSKIKTTIRQNLTPRHVPKYVESIEDIPYTRNGKKVEIAITQILRGEEPTNIRALANPECLQAFRDWAKKGKKG
jgi:acetoacetyl-CoA synthetase